MLADQALKKLDQNDSDSPSVNMSKAKLRRRRRARLKAKPKRVQPNKRLDERLRTRLTRGQRGGKRC